MCATPCVMARPVAQRVVSRGGLVRNALCHGGGSVRDALCQRVLGGFAPLYSSEEI